MAPTTTRLQPWRHFNNVSKEVYQAREPVPHLFAQGLAGCF